MQPISSRTNRLQPLSMLLCAAIGIAGTAACGAATSTGVAEPATEELHAAPADHGNRPTAAPDDEAAQLWSLGVRALNRRDWSAADAAFTRLLELVPDSADIRQNRAVARLMNLEVEAARADFDRALLLDPGHPQLRRNAAIAYLWMGLDAEAERALAGVEPSNELSLLAAIVALRQDNPDLALRRLDDLENIPTDANLAWRVDSARGIAHAMRGDIAEALLWFDRAAAAQPGSPAPIMNRARTLLAAGDHEAAYDALREYLRVASPAAPDRGAVEELLRGSTLP